VGVGTIISITSCYSK